MLATFAQFEREVRRLRQLEGIASVKSDPKLRRVKYAGRKPSVDRAAVARMAADDMKPGAIAKAPCPAYDRVAHHGGGRRGASVGLTGVSLAPAEPRR